MMEENNRKGPGIFYAVMGVATLVVAIIGATFAFFSATADVEGEITGEAATVDLSVVITKESTDATGKLVPQLDTTIQTAVTGSEGKSCVDGSGNTVCQVYSIAITNGGTSAIDVTANLAFTGTYKNLKWGKGTTATSGFGTVNTAVIENSPTDLTDTDGHVVIGASQTQTYYVVVYISETGSPQQDDDKGIFTGAVTVNTVGGTGNGLTSTFTA